jgi:hypothetical protein
MPEECRRPLRRSHHVKARGLIACLHGFSAQDEGGARRGNGALL